MSIDRTVHVPFTEFTLADRFFYWICADVAIGLLRPWQPTIGEIGKDMVRIWEEQKFAPADVLDLVSMAERLKPHLAMCTVTDPRAWIPERPCVGGARRRTNSKAPTRVPRRTGTPLCLNSAHSPHILLELSEIRDKRHRNDLDPFVLALIDGRVSTPYELKTAAGLSPGATIPALRRLLDDKLVAQEKPGPRGRTDHKITAEGQQRLKTGWRDLIDQGPSGDPDADLRVALLALWVGDDRRLAAGFLRQ